jgi:threonine dehydrogenase-like Zn-dependent dehydrogenase
MATMKVSVLPGVGQVDVEERTVPEPAADDVLVEVGSVGVCGSDVHYYEHGRIGPYVVPWWRCSSTVVAVVAFAFTLTLVSSSMRWPSSRQPRTRW